MMVDSVGQAWQLFAVMDDDKLLRIVAKNPDRPQVIDVTDDICTQIIRAMNEAAKDGLIR